MALGVLVVEVLSVEGAWKGYSRGGQHTEVLADVSLAVEPGEVVAIVGARWEGKTTLLEIAAGMAEPDKGRVLLDGTAFWELPRRARPELLRKKVAWINRTVPKQNWKAERVVGGPHAMEYGRREAERMAARTLEQVGAKDCIGRAWRELSNWQRVLVGLARAFVGDPSLVVIDDLLDALGDPRTEQASDIVREMLEAPERRCGVLISASDVASALYADRIWSLTSRGTLKALAGQRPEEPQVIQFPTRDVGSG